MPVTEWKDINFKGEDYRVSREELPGKIVYTAWEKTEFPYAKRVSPSFITKMSHSRVTKEGTKVWGAIDKRSVPMDIEVMTPMNQGREEAEIKFRVASFQLGITLIGVAYPATRNQGKLIDGQVVVATDKYQLDEKPLPGERSSRSPVKQDRISEMLAVADFARLKLIAKANDVPCKDTDTAGLLKMRVINALRNKVKKGEAIKQ